MNKTLEEIIKIAKEALEVTNKEVLDTKVTQLTKTGYVSVGGVLDSIILLAENMVVADPSKDAIDRPERHSIAGHMNDPSDNQRKAFEEGEKDV